MDHHVASSAADPPFGSPGWEKADEALRAIGTNAIPTLLTMIRAKDPPRFMAKIMETANRHGLTWIRHRDAEMQQEEADYAFGILGTNAAGAVPELIRIYEQNPAPASQAYAARALGHIGPPARPALPGLIRRFADPDASVRFYAVSAVMQIGGDPAVVVPALTSALKDPSVNVRWNALSGLSRFGSRARPAAPEILRMIDDPGMVGTSSMTQQVATTLWRIAPELVGLPLVVEEATPMIVDGVTVEAVKAVFLGTRKILIPPGRSVPTLAQYWNSDPRPKLSLYRGATESDRTDHFLGDFEVMELPDSPSLNISTLCVVADGKIFLCARDNHREIFLPIRRVPAATEL